jgi:hypothetical protein
MVEYHWAALKQLFRLSDLIFELMLISTDL